MKKKFIISCLSIFVLVSNTFAQKNLSEQVNVVRPYKPILAEAVKINTNPEIKFEQSGKTNPEYYFLSHRIDSNMKFNPVTVDKMKNESIAKLYPYYVRVGGGNYKNTYLEAWANNMRSKEWVLSAHYLHRAFGGTTDKNIHRISSENTINTYAKRIYEKQTVNLSMMYDRDVNHFFGYDYSEIKVDRKKVKQIYNLFGLQSEVLSNNNSKDVLKYNGRFDFYTLKDDYSASENRFSINGTAAYKEFESKILFDLAKYKDTLDQSNNLFGMENVMHLSEAGIDFNVGFNLYNQSGNNSSFHIYPNVSASYKIEDFDAKVYAGLKGGIRKNSLRNMYSENPFIRNNIDIQNTNEKVNLFAGIRGRIDSKNSYHVNITYLKTDNELYYLADGDKDTITRFYAIYDGPEASEFQLNVNFAHQSSEKLRINAALEYRNFKTDTLLQALNKPNTRVSVTTEYNIANKFLLEAELYSFSKMYGADIFGERKTLASGIDLNFGIDYRYSKMISVYLNLNNVLNYKRESFMYYQGFGFQALLGASFRF